MRLFFLYLQKRVEQNTVNQFHIIMKKLSVLAFAAAALALAGCQFEKAVPDQGQTTVRASRELSTRSYLERTYSLGDEATHYTVYWNAPDKILVAYAGVAPETFTSTNDKPATEATFKGILPSPAGDKLYGIYPAESGNSVDADGKFKIVFHPEQTAVEGSYDPDACPAVAVSESKNLEFYNICGLLALQVGFDDVSKIALSMGVEDPTAAPAGPEALVRAFPSGTLTVEMKGGVPEITNATTGAAEIVLLPPSGAEAFAPGKTYYMVVPPESIEDGVTFKLTRASGVVNYSIPSAVSVERAKVHEVPAFEAPDEPVAYGRISYDGGETWQPLYAAGMYVNEERGGMNILFVGDAEFDFSEKVDYAPSCDYFGIDIDISILGQYTLPQNLDTDYWMCYCSWKGLGSFPRPYSLTGSLDIGLSEDRTTVDLEIDVTYSEWHVIASYSGPVVPSSDYMHYW